MYAKRRVEVYNVRRKQQTRWKQTIPSLEINLALFSSAVIDGKIYLFGTYNIYGLYTVGIPGLLQKNVKKV